MAPKKDKQVVYKAKGGESLCEVAANHGFPHCKPLRDANPDLVDRKVLLKKDEVTIPPKVEGKDSGPDKSQNKFVQPNYPLPNGWFIKETGAGYPSPEPAPEDEGFNPHYPKTDPVQKRLEFSNYHVDKAGDGTAAFAGPTVYANHTDSSKDPDHFKIQVYDTKIPKGNTEVKVILHAMRPSYKKVTIKKFEYFLWTANYYYPTTADRKLEVTCKRVGKTNYFRSPYLRLTTTETDATSRPGQALLVKDYFADGADDDHKRYTEILHHKVRLTYKIDFCPVSKCEAIKDARLKVDRELRLGIHLIQGTTADKPKAREQIYKWMRRCLAQANVRPHLKVLRTVKIPKNMITVSDGDGRHASGKKSDGNDSEMKITVAGKDYTHKPRVNDSPRKTALKLKRLLEKDGYKVDGPHLVKVDGLTPSPGSVSSPRDILVFDKKKKLVEVTSVSSDDTRQGLRLTDDINVNNFLVGWPFQPRSARAMYHNYRTRFFDIFVCGTTLRLQGGSTLFGFSPYGRYGGWKTDIGPISFLNGAAMDPAQKPFNPTHEMLHPLAHVHHTRSPGGAGAGTHPYQYEMMNGSTSVADSKDATKHLGDSPIEITYRIIYGTGSKDVLLDGTAHGVGGGKTVKDTPVKRFRRVAATYKQCLKKPSARRFGKG